MDAYIQSDWVASSDELGLTSSTEQWGMRWSQLLYVTRYPGVFWATMCRVIRLPWVYLYPGTSIDQNSVDFIWSALDSFKFNAQVFYLLIQKSCVHMYHVLRRCKTYLFQKRWYQQWLCVLCWSKHLIANVIRAALIIHNVPKIKLSTLRPVLAEIF